MLAGGTPSGTVITDRTEEVSDSILKVKGFYLLVWTASGGALETSFDLFYLVVGCNRYLTGLKYYSVELNGSGIR